MTYAGTCTHMRLHTHRRLYTRTVLQSVAAVTHAGTSHTHTDTCAHFYTLTFLHARKRFDTRTSFPHSRFCTPASTHRRLDTHAQAGKHTGTFARRCSYTPMLSHRRFCTRAQISGKKLFVSISKSIRFPYITQLKYCKKLGFEADLNNKVKPLMKKTGCFDFDIN